MYRLRRLPAAARSLKSTTHFVDILGGVIGKGVAIRLTSIMAASVKGRLALSSNVTSRSLPSNMTIPVRKNSGQGYKIYL